MAVMTNVLLLIPMLLSSGESEGSIAIRDVAATDSADETSDVGLRELVLTCLAGLLGSGH